jgi:hypothetical protein
MEFIMIDHAFVILTVSPLLISSAYLSSGYSWRVNSEFKIAVVISLYHTKSSCLCFTKSKFPITPF